MKLNRIGEFALINKLTRGIKLDSSVVVGPGDDCAVIKYSDLCHMLFTCDMIIEDVDFTRKDSPELIGRKALAICLSDIASCGGTPGYAVASFGLPANTDLSFAQSLSKGFLKLAKQYKVNVVGGDISRSDKIIIDTSLIGFVRKKELVLRSGAKNNDRIFVTGSLGGTIKGKHLGFTPRIKEAQYLVRNFKINAMIDISDGLLQDLNHILHQSNKGAVIYQDLIPVSNQAVNMKDALSAGEDFELLFTCSSKEAERLLKKNVFHFTPIGKITDGPCRVRILTGNNRQIKISGCGYDHFN